MKVKSNNEGRTQAGMDDKGAMRKWLAACRRMELAGFLKHPMEGSRIHLQVPIAEAIKAFIGYAWIGWCLPTRCVRITPLFAKCVCEHDRAALFEKANDNDSPWAKPVLVEFKSRGRLRLANQLLAQMRIVRMDEQIVVRGCAVGVIEVWPLVAWQDRYDRPLMAG